MRCSVSYIFSRPRLSLRPNSARGNLNSYSKPPISALSTYRQLYECIEDVESLEYYQPGGYHPIQVGNIFQERYEIVHKLGHGSYSTIWLARDEKMGKFVAMKVGIADHGPKESDILSRMSASAPRNGDGELGSGLIPPVLDQFDIRGPNGTHPCLITTPARCSLIDAFQASDYDPFQLPIARSLASQLAMAVAYVHGSGHAHGGEH